jgi:hypothetical protein
MGLQPVLVLSFITPFHLLWLICFISLGCNATVKEWECFFPCLGRALSCIVSWHFPHYSCCWKHCIVGFGIAQNFKWKLVYMFGWPWVVLRHSFHSVFKSSLLSLSIGGG